MLCLSLNAFIGTRPEPAAEASVVTAVTRKSVSAQTVYNLKVARTRTYALAGVGVVVHNNGSSKKFFRENLTKFTEAWEAFDAAIKARNMAGISDTYDRIIRIRKEIVSHVTANGVIHADRLRQLEEAIRKFPGLSPAERFRFRVIFDALDKAREDLFPLQ